MITLSLIVLCILLVISSIVLYNKKSLGKLPKGDRLDRVRQSPHFSDGKFHNIEDAQLGTKTDKGIVSRGWKFVSKKRTQRKPNEPILTEYNNLHHLDTREDILVWFGHSSYFIQLSGKRFLIDPVLTNRFPMSLMFRPFKGAAAYSPDDIPPLDFVIITHDHWDHLDYHTLMQLRHKIGKFVCALGIGQHLEHWGFQKDQIVEMDWNDTLTITPSLSLHCLTSRHFSGRGIKANRTLWASFMLCANNFNLYLSGDGGYGEHFTQIRQQYGTIDFAVLENGQYNPDWHLIHVMPEKLEQIVHDLQPIRFMTVHHSKYALSKHAWDEPLANVNQLINKTSSQVEIPAIGEIVYLRPEHAIHASSAF